ncbi:MAG: hypothetical protein EPN23_05930 [Verrucomicrobia bacterium]|nr:MAG: hypothetical protein EPN23_05930 [Verrucomicrobiota bacterium]
MSERRWDGFWVRLPFLLLAVGLFVLYVRLPYRILNSDVAVFGLMGEDILRYGYLPTYAYGQNYLFSLLPYVYAAIQWLIPTLSNIMTLKVAGFALSIIGLWLWFEALLLAQQRNHWSRGVAATVFCLLVASSSSYLFDIQEHSSLELSLFLLGLISFFAARIDLALATQGQSRGVDWLLFGIGLAHALYSRPLVLAYGVVMLIWLVAAAWQRTPDWRLRWPLYGLLAGVLIGYLPMLLHGMLRAPAWPYDFHTHTPLAHCDKAHPGSSVFWTIFRIIFDLRLCHGVLSTIIIIWLLATGWFLLRYLQRDRRQALTVLDVALPLGTLLIVAVMGLFPNLSVNATHRRYCEHAFLVAVWLFARFALPTLQRRWLVVGGAVILLLASLQSWRARLFYEVHVNDEMAQQLPAMVAELKEYKTPILADFWVAYELRFIAGGDLLIETYPWQFVRTYNAVPRVCLEQRCLWLVHETASGAVKQELRARAHPGTWEHRPVHALRSPMLFRQFEYWEIGAPTTPDEWRAHEGKADLHYSLWELDPHESVRLMAFYNPRYFLTPNPLRP